MKLRNKKTGEIGDLLPYGGEDGKIWVWIDNMSRPEYRYNSLAELNEEWEDYEEPSKTIWQIKDSGELQDFEEDDFSDGYMESSKSIGNYFETEEEAEKAVEKLKAWKRMKDKGFMFTGIMDEYINAGTPYNIQPLRTERNIGFNKSEDLEWIKDNRADLDLLFGGEE